MGAGEALCAAKLFGAAGGLMAEKLCIFAALGVEGILCVPGKLNSHTVLRADGAVVGRRRDAAEL